MVSSLYSFDPIISTNEIGKYFSFKNTHHQWERTSLANPLHRGKSVKEETTYSIFKLDVGVCNFNHTNEFFSISNFCKTEKTKSQSTLPKALRILHTKERSLFDTSTTSKIIESVCKIALFLIAAYCFSLIVVTEVFCMRFLGSVG